MATKPRSPVAFGAPEEPKVEYPDWMTPVEYRPPVDTAAGREQLLSNAVELDNPWNRPHEPGDERTARALADAEARRSLCGGLPDAPDDDMPAVSVQGGKPFKI